jgi:hypothetical protein
VFLGKLDCCFFVFAIDFVNNALFGQLCDGLVMEAMAGVRGGVGVSLTIFVEFANSVVSVVSLSEQQTIVYDVEFAC